MSFFWNKVLSLMNEQGLRKLDVIKRLNIPGSTFHTWVKRDCLPQVDDALHLADLLGVSVRYLVTGQDPAELPYRVKELLRLAQGLNESELIYFCDQIKNYRVLEDRKKGEASPGSSESAGS